MRRLNKFAATALSSTMLAAFAITPAYAQDAQAEEESYENEPIIVTATLRAADVQDIPIAVTAVAPETLERQGIADIKSLSSITPKLQYPVVADRNAGHIDQDSRRRYNR